MSSLVSFAASGICSTTSSAPIQVLNYSRSRGVCCKNLRRRKACSEGFALGKLGGGIHSRIGNLGGTPFRSVIVKSTSEDAVMQAEELEMDAQDRMVRSLDSIKGNLNTIRTGRANPAILERIEVDYYGAPTPLMSLAGISVPDAQTLLISPYDKGALPEIDKAIASSDIGIMPNNDGDKIRLSIPQLTEERRKEMSKLAAKYGEEGKIALRNIRRDTLKSIGKLQLPEDDEVSYKNDLQKLTDDYVKNVDELVKAKETELLTM